MHVKHKIQMLIIVLTLSGNVLKPDYPDYNIIMNGSPYPSKLFIHSMSSSDPNQCDAQAVDVAVCEVQGASVDPSQRFPRSAVDN